MKVKILFFGATADAAGTRCVEIDIGENTTSAEVFDRVVADHPRLAGHKLLFAVNEEYSSGREVLDNGDELAIFTAVSGG
jgi:molybdopterin converting factor small subunit